MIYVKKFLKSRIVYFYGKEPLHYPHGYCTTLICVIISWRTVLLSPFTTLYFIPLGPFRQVKCTWQVNILEKYFYNTRVVKEKNKNSEPWTKYKAGCLNIKQNLKQCLKHLSTEKSNLFELKNNKMVLNLIYALLN